MKFSFSLTFLFALLIIQETIFPTMADRQTIKKTCKGTPNYNLCLQILLADPKSEDADVTGLALIVVNDAVKVKGEKTIKQIEDLKVSRPDLREELDECAKKYHIVVNTDVPLSNRALNLGNPKFAEDGMADTAVKSQVCEGSFGDHGQTSPLTDMNKAVEDVANVARAIIRMLL